jgi:hypothetical protein
MEIVLGYSGYDFINETKMGTKSHQDEVKSWVLMHQDEASRQSKRTYGSPNSESGCTSYGARKFAYLGKTGLTGFGCCAA